MHHPATAFGELYNQRQVAPHHDALHVRTIRAAAIPLQNESREKKKKKLGSHYITQVPRWHPEANLLPWPELPMQAPDPEP
jgi:hypothetical protein